MKKHHIFTFFLMLCAVFQCAQAFKAYTYVVKSDYDSKDAIPLTGTYKGNILDLKDGIAFLNETEYIGSFELIITSEHPKMCTEPVPHLERIQEADCEWYHISWVKEGTKTVWSIEKRPEESLPPRIPDNALIICYPPKFVDKIENKMPQESSTIIHLPTIILKKNLSAEEKEERDAALNRSILAHLEVSASLAPATQLVRQGNKVKQARGI